MVKITFPHMGNLSIGLEAMFTKLGFETIVPPPTGPAAITLGGRYAREGACLPFKINLGNYLQALELGADTIVMLGGGGPCRFGYFGHLQQQILEDLGCPFKMIILENGCFREQIGYLLEAAGNKYWWDAAAAIHFGWVKLRAADEIEALTHRVRPRERVPGSTTESYHRFLKHLRGAVSVAEVRTLTSEVRSALAQLAKCSDRQSSSKGAGHPLKVGLVGDIYMLLEPACNGNIAELLGELGVEVTRSIYLTHWVQTNLGGVENSAYGKNLLRLARPFLRGFVGGHGLDTVGNAVRYAAAGFDGLIQILPLTCMPEIVAKGILPEVSSRCGLPVLTLVMDGHMAEEGFRTRVEAFVDLLGRKEKNF